MASSGLEPALGVRPGGGASRKVLRAQRVSNIAAMDVIEIELRPLLPQGLAVLRALGLRTNAPHVNPNGRAPIALGHPLA